MQNLKKTYIKLFLLILVAFSLQHCGDLNTSQGLFFIPEKSDFNLYIKDYPAFSEQVKLLPFYKKLKDNYIVEDIQGRFAKNVNLFFFQIDFDFDFLTSQLGGELILGEMDKSYYLIASVKYTAQLLNNLFHLLPSEKTESFSYNGAECTIIKRNQRNFYYTFLGNFILVSNQRKTLESMLDAASAKTNSISDYLLKNSNKRSLSLHISNTGPLSWRKLLFPAANHFFVDLNLASRQISLGALPTENESALTSKITKNLLKNLPYETPAFYSSSHFSLDKLLSLLENNPVAKNALSELEKKHKINLNNWKPFFTSELSLGFWGFEKGSSSSTSSIIPKLSLIFTLNEKISAEEKNKLIKDLKNLFHIFLGSENWRTLVNTPKDYHSYQSQTKQISFLLFKNHLAINFSNAVQKAFLNQLQKEPASLYDLIHPVLPSFEPTALLTLNPALLIKELEPFFKGYASNKAQLTQKEYEKSYGGILQTLKQQPPSALFLGFDQEKKVFSGALNSKTD